MGYIIVPDGIKVNARASGNILADVVQVLDSGTMLPTLGRNEQGYWVKVLLKDGEEAWVGSEVVIISDFVLNHLPVVDNPPVEPESTPVVMSIPTPPAEANTPTEPRKHVIEPGDSLWNLSERYYGDGRFWPLIYENNREVIGDEPTSLTVGTELVIPNLPSLGKQELLALAASVRR